MSVRNLIGFMYLFRRWLVGHPTYNTGGGGCWISRRTGNDLKNLDRICSF